jgi:hypothetical protein
MEHLHRICGATSPRPRPAAAGARWVGEGSSTRRNGIARSADDVFEPVTATSHRASPSLPGGGALFRLDRPGLDRTGRAEPAGSVRRMGLAPDGVRPRHPPALRIDGRRFRQFRQCPFCESLRFAMGTGSVRRRVGPMPGVGRVALHAAGTPVYAARGESIVRTGSARHGDGGHETTGSGENGGTRRQRSGRKGRRRGG